MKLVAITAVAFATFAHAPAAGAFSACNGADHWSPGTRDELPPHAHVVYTSDRPTMPKALSARIDGQIVPTKLITYDVKPYHFVLVEIRSEATGKLELAWLTGKDNTPSGFASATYTIVAKPTYAKTAHAKTERFHTKLAHSTVREVFDGLQIAVDVPAVLAHVKLRRDAKALWNEFDVPVGDDRTIKIGELGCASNYASDLLEAGVDTDIVLTLPDNTQVPVELKHASIPKRSKPTGTKPWDSD